MKLHDLVTDPTKLKTYGKYISVKDAYKQVLDGNQDPRLVLIIAQDPKYAYHYAHNVIKGRFPKGETIISKNPIYAYYYALNVIKGKFPEGEEAIASDSNCAYYYALDVIKGRWPKGEKAIAKSPIYLQKYTKLIANNK